MMMVLLRLGSLVLEILLNRRIVLLGSRQISRLKIL